MREVELPPASLERFRTVLDDVQWAQLEDAAVRARRQFEGRVVWNVNSTARGGGVAELLGSLVPYSRAAGVDVRWVVIDGDPAFFRVTKRLHNMLHGFPGDGEDLSAGDAKSYAAAAEANARRLTAVISPGDLVLLHDPQTAGLVAPLRRHGAQVVWRCHVGVDAPNDIVMRAWSFLLPHVADADRLVFSRAAFVWHGLDRSRVAVIAPSIDAFTPKNQPLPPGAVESILRAAEVHAEASNGPAAFRRIDGTTGHVVRRVERNGSPPLPGSARAVVQVSRWDRLKDPVGVLRAFVDGVAPSTDAHLVLAGPSTAAVADDPEGPEVLADIASRVDRLPDAMRERIHLLSLPMEDPEENAVIVNALQRRADVVVQKSIAEGFGLTVAEAMWKARPVVASAVGGIQDQIVDGQSGVLVQPDDLGEFAGAVVGLLRDPERAEWMGDNARERVRDAFLGARHLAQYVDLFEGVRGTTEPARGPSPMSAAPGSGKLGS